MQTREFYPLRRQRSIEAKNGFGQPVQDLDSLPKQLVIDKDVFQGTDQASLCKFVKNHCLILPEGLLYECLTDSKQKPNLSGRFEQVILAGAYICPPVRTIVFKEAQKLSPYRFLPDLEMTTGIRRAIRKKNKFFDPHEIQDTYEKHCERAKTILDAASHSVETIAAQDPEILERAKRYQDDRSGRFRVWVESVTCGDVHKLVIEKLGHLTDTPERFCLSDGWITWHYFCFVCVLHLEYAFLRITQGETPKPIRAEHDCQDVEYVTYLSRADGLLTRDKKLVEPLARAAFPEKDVFSSLDEVPDEYLCNWGEN